MSKLLFYLAKYYLVWIAIFFLERLIFIGYFFSKIFPISFSEFGLIFLYSIRIDASMAAYICAIPLLLFIIQWFIPSLKLPPILLKAYSITILVMCALLMAVNLNVYEEWNVKLPYRIISTLIEYPYEAMVSSASSPFLIPLLLALLVVTIGYFLITNATQPITYNPKVKWPFKALISLTLIAISFFIIRSGLQTTPLNPSMAYFSTKPILNHAALNTEWNLISDFLHNSSSNKNPYRYMDEDAAIAKIHPYINSSSQPIEVLTQEKPNVVLIILESFTSDLVESLGGEAGIAPNFEKIIQNGLLFTDIYAASDRTDKGIVAIMSGFPSQGNRSIIKNVNKLESTPAIGQSFLENGYTTSFFHGGESEFYNFKSYMLSHSIQMVVDQHDFDAKDVNSKWGAFDHLTFQKQLDYLNKSTEPFFSILLTLSNHEPFEVPGTPHFGSKSLADLFKSTAFYTDSALYNYLEKAKNTNWYKNTLFVIIADHAHRLPLNKWDSHHPNRYRIPLLFYGEVLKPEFRGKKITKIGNQTDLASTMLNQLKIKSDKYYWSKDLLDPNTPDFGFFAWNSGFGIVTPEQTVTYDAVGKLRSYLKNDSVDESINKEIESIGQAYMQEVYQQYLNY